MRFGRSERRRLADSFLIHPLQRRGRVILQSRRYSNGIALRMGKSTYLLAAAAVFLILCALIAGTAANEAATSDERTLGTLFAKADTCECAVRRAGVTVFLSPTDDYRLTSRRRARCLGQELVLLRARRPSPCHQNYQAYQDHSPDKDGLCDSETTKTPPPRLGRDCS